MIRSGGLPSGTAALARQIAVPYILAKTAIPFIGLSSGSVSSVGAISGITALPTTYANAYCWFPANALATAIAAGWYYCTFSGTSAGTAFLNTYTSGIPTLPASPTAVIDGKGAFTGDTGEEFGLTITVPANTIGPNGGLKIELASIATSNANNKTTSIRYSGNAGTQVQASIKASYANRWDRALIMNRGVTNSQAATSGGIEAGLIAGPLLSYPTVDTTASSTIVISQTRATATDNVAIESLYIELFSDGT